jgi:predicted nucleic acid-binding protein
MAKRYVREPGRAELLKSLARRGVVSSFVMPLELHSMFARRVRDGVLATVALPRLYSRVADDRERWTLVTATAEVLSEVEALLEAQPLRTLDALHLASARVFQRRVRVPVLFATADRRQATVAGRLGMETRLV